MTKTTALKFVALPLPHPSTLTEADWFLFDMPGSEKAGAALTDALCRALTAKTEEEAWSVMNCAMDRWAGWGACDTEPRGVARDYIRAMFHKATLQHSSFVMVTEAALRGLEALDRAL